MAGMSSPVPNREALVTAVSGELGQELSTVTVLFHALLAERLGLGPTDHKALSLLARHGPLTAGALARLTGLTTGAVTGVVDRLERAGYVQRMADPNDRRKVMIAVRASPAEDAVFAEVFAPLLHAMRELCDGYTDAELATIYRFMQAGIAVLQQQIARLSGSATPDAAT